MMRLLFMSDDIEQTVALSDSFRNDRVAAVAIGMAVTALTQKVPAIACIGVVFVFLWGLNNLWSVRHEHVRYYASIHVALRDLTAISRNPVFCVAVSFLVFVAAGVVTMDDLVRVFK